MKLHPEYAFAVVGSGPAAKLALFRWTLANPNTKALWIQGSGHDWEPILPQSSSTSIPFLESTLTQLGFESLEWGVDWKCKEYRNKAFQPLDREKEEYWGPEQFLIESNSVGWPLEMHSWIRLLDEQLKSNSLIDVIQGDPISTWKVDSHSVEVILGSGAEYKAARMVYADLWNTLSSTHGLPKASLGFTRLADSLGVLQLELNHPARVGLGLDNSFSIPMSRESGETHQRHVWGYFKNGGRSSLWTVLLGFEESEDNHEIAKRIRKMKQTLNKVFVGEPWVSQPKKEFCDELEGERVKFVDGGILHFHKPLTEIPCLPKSKEVDERRVYFISDGQGLSTVFESLDTLNQQGVFSLPFDWGAKPQDVGTQETRV